MSDTFIYIHISKNPDLKTPSNRIAIPFFPKNDTLPEVVEARNAIVAMVRKVGNTLFEAKPVTQALARSRKNAKARKAGRK